MIFTIDKQTISDLELKEKSKDEKSIFSLYNYTKTSGGKSKLELFFNNPLTDVTLLESRIQVLKYLLNSKAKYRFDKKDFDFIEFYLTQQNVPDRFSVSESLFKAVSNLFKPRNDYYIIQRGISHLIRVLNEFYSGIIDAKSDDSPHYILNCRDKITDILENSPLKIVVLLKNRITLNPLELGKLDYYFRKSFRNEVREILDIIYEFDAFLSVVECHKKLGFSFPEYSRDANFYQVEGLFHPFLHDPVSNNFEFTPQKKICFLTGPNMAGKSTFLKSLSISIYLSHIGFPVPAARLTTSIFNGLLTTINLPDNITKGYSHFYTEVLRVKYVAEKINQSGNLFVVFDEIFRGTNVKDAYEATLAVLSSFSKLNNSLFAVSTHIIEVGEQLRKHDSVFFKFFEANFVDGTPHYTFSLHDGITDERIGMYILSKEKVIEIIENRNNDTGS